MGKPDFEVGAVENQDQQMKLERVGQLQSVPDPSVLELP